jgi:hypothetical protein
MCARSVTRWQTRHRSSNEGESGAHDATEALSLPHLQSESCPPGSRRPSGPMDRGQHMTKEAADATP